MKHSLFLLFALTILLAGPAQSQPIQMRVAVNDDTDTNPLSSTSEVWIRGVGTWPLDHATRFGGDMKQVPIESLSKVDTLYVYPDGRDSGKEIAVPYAVTSDMCRSGCPRDMLRIAISDARVTVFGRPLEAAVGELEQVFKR